MTFENAADLPLEAIWAINTAYADACAIIEIQGGDEDTRQRMADHMLYLAGQGETDSDTLCSKSVMVAFG